MRSRVSLGMLITGRACRRRYCRVTCPSGLTTSDLKSREHEKDVIITQEGSTHIISDVNQDTYFSGVGR
jgi:hypothetical protein